MRCDERKDQSGQNWWFVIEEDIDRNHIWIFKKPVGADRAEYYLADEVWDWIEVNCPRGTFMAYPSMCAIAFKDKSQAMLFRLTWDNNGPYFNRPA